MKQKLYSEAEIFEKIDGWRNIEIEGAWSSKRKDYDSHKCSGQDGADICFTKKDFELLIKELKQKFMTARGFRKVIERTELTFLTGDNKNG